MKLNLVLVITLAFSGCAGLQTKEDVASNTLAIGVLRNDFYQHAKKNTRNYYEVLEMIESLEARIKALESRWAEHDESWQLKKKSLLDIK